MILKKIQNKFQIILFGISQSGSFGFVSNFGFRASNFWLLRSLDTRSDIYTIKLPTAAAMNKIKVTRMMVRRSAGAPINTAIPVFTRVFEITAMTIV
jgi:hypothetical protein